MSASSDQDRTARQAGEGGPADLMQNNGHGDGERTSEDAEGGADAVTMDGLLELVGQLQQALDASRERADHAFAAMKTLELEIEQQDRLAWETDSSSNTCRRCDVAFGIWTRRHHCRRCGKLFCRNCSKVNPGNKVRLCVRCTNKTGTCRA